MVPISSRMKLIADMVPEGLSVADIGCDHGYVSIYLVTEKNIPYCVAMDVKRGPLQRAQEHIEQYGLSDVIQTRLSDGAKNLFIGEVQAAVIAGMGGHLTVKILSQSEDKFKAMKSLILSPQSDMTLVRNYLAENGYSIADEEMIEEDEKYYTVMRVEYDGVIRHLGEGELEYGPVLISKKNPVLIQFLEKKQLLMETLRDRLITAYEQCPKEETASKLENVKGNLALIVETLEKMKVG